MKPNIGEMLTQFFELRRIRRAALARLLNVQTSTIIGYQKKESIQVKTLWDISNLVSHNFFMDIAQMLPENYTTSKNIFKEKDAEIAALKAEVKKLTIERNLLIKIKQ